jgi:hypothetical protein
MRVLELANDSEDLDQVPATFPPSLNMTDSTCINGPGAFDALYLAKVKELVNDIWSHRHGPFGTAGYACIVVATGLFGKAARDKLAPYFVLAMLQLSELITKLETSA